MLQYLGENNTFLFQGKIEQFPLNLVVTKRCVCVEIYIVNE